MRSLDLESKRPCERAFEAEVVEQRGHGENLGIVRDVPLSRDAHGEQPGSHRVIEEVGLVIRARVLDRPRDERCVGHGHAGDG